MKNTHDIVQIIDVHIHSRQMHICVKYGKSNTNILGVIEMNEVGNKYGCQKNI